MRTELFKKVTSLQHHKSAKIPPPPPEYPASALDFATQLLKFLPDTIQAYLLSCHLARVILNCCRQWGKSTVTSILALHHALSAPERLIVILSPSARQSAELLAKIAKHLRLLNIRPRGDGHNEISLLLPNNSRIVGLPGKDATIRGFSSVSLLIIDEAARVSDELYAAVRPMLAAAPDAMLWLISTPAGCSGFFHSIFTSGDPEWTRISIPADQCPRITPTFLAEERRNMTQQNFRQEYLCEFIDTVDTIYSADILQAALVPAKPLIQYPGQPNIPQLIKNNEYRAHLQHLLSSLPKPPSDIRHYIGLDLGQKVDYTALAIIEHSYVVSGEFNPVTWDYPRSRSLVIRHLERFPLDIPYTEIVNEVCRLLRHPNLADKRLLIVDSSGAGAPVVEMLRNARPNARMIPVTITAGQKSSNQGDNWNVPREELLSRLETGLRNGQLHIADTLTQAPYLIEELRHQRRNSAPTSNHHDDLVFATALAFWRATL